MSKAPSVSSTTPAIKVPCFQVVAYPLKEQVWKDSMLHTAFDKSFQRNACWTDKQNTAYITALIKGMAPSAMIVANTRECLKNITVSSAESGDESRRDADYFRGHLDNNLTSISIDGQNRTTAITKFFANQVPIKTGTYYLFTGESIDVMPNANTWKTLPQKLRDYMAQHIQLSVTQYTTATRAQLSEIYINVNAGSPLNHQELRNAQLTDIASMVRTFSTKYKNALNSRWWTENYRLKRDDQILNCMMYYRSPDQPDLSNPRKDWVYTTGNNVMLDKMKKGGEKIINHTMELIINHGGVHQTGNRFWQKPHTLLNFFMLMCHICERDQFKILDKERFVRWFVSTENKRKTERGPQHSLGKRPENGCDFVYSEACNDVRSLFLEQRKLRILKDFKTIPAGVVTPIDSTRYFSEAQRAEAWERQGGVCPHTGKRIPEHEIHNSLLWQADHVVPHSLGGKTDMNNCELVDRQYNATKGNRVLTNGA